MLSNVVKRYRLDLEGKSKLSNDIDWISRVSQSLSNDIDWVSMTRSALDSLYSLLAALSQTRGGTGGGGEAARKGLMFSR